DDPDRYRLFAAVFLDRLAFAPGDLERIFPSLPEPHTVAAVLAEDVDAAALLARSRPSGTADPEPEPAPEQPWLETAPPTAPRCSGRRPPAGWRVPRGSGRTPPPGRRSGSWSSGSGRCSTGTNRPGRSGGRRSTRCWFPRRPASGRGPPAVSTSCRRSRPS